MPLYTFKCPACDFVVEKYIALHNLGTTTYGCNDCSTNMRLLITAPLLVKAAPDVAYDSPVDGRHITSWDARREDLKRHNSQPYDPAMKQDSDRRVQESAAALDRAVDEHVERAIEQMPTKKRGQLHSELFDKSADVAYARDTPG